MRAQTVESDESAAVSSAAGSVHARTRQPGKHEKRRQRGPHRPRCRQAAEGSPSASLRAGSRGVPIGLAAGRQQRGPHRPRCGQAAEGQDTLQRPGHTLEAATMPVGRRLMTSLAKEGPDRKAQGCLRPSTSGMISDIILPVPTSRPLLTDRMGTSWGSSSCRGSVGVPEWPPVRLQTGWCACRGLHGRRKQASLPECSPMLRGRRHHVTHAIPAAALDAHRPDRQR